MKEMLKDLCKEVIICFILSFLGFVSWNYVVAPTMAWAYVPYFAVVGMYLCAWIVITPVTRALSDHRVEIELKPIRIENKNSCDCDCHCEHNALDEDRGENSDD